MKMNMKDKAVYELPLCLTREQVTHLQKEMFLFAKKKSFVFLLSPYLVNHGKAAANVKKYIFIFILCLIHKDWQWPTESYVIQIQISLNSDNFSDSFGKLILY